MELDQFRDVDLVIDRANDSFVQKQFVSQGDYKGRSLTVQVTDNGVVGEVAGLTLNLRWTNQASGLTDLSAFTVIDKENSVFRIEYPEHMMTPGEVVASIQVLQGGKSTFLKPFTITVQRLAGEAVGIIQKAEFSALVAVLADSNKFRADIDSLDTIKADKSDLKDTNQNVANLGANKVDKGGASQISWGMLDQNAKDQATGETPPAYVGPDSVGAENVILNSVMLGNLNKEARNEISEVVTIPLEQRYGYYSSLQNTFVENSGFLTIETEASIGETFFITSTVASSTTSLCIFWDSEGNQIQSIKLGEVGSYTDEQVRAPGGTAKISVSSTLAFPPIIKKLSPKKIASYEQLVEATSDFEVQNLEHKSGFYNRNTGLWTNNAGFITIETAVEEDEVWNVDTYPSTSSLAAVLFFGETKSTPIGYLEIGGDGKIFNEYKFKIPSGAKRMATSSKRTHVPVFRKQFSISISELKKEVENLIVNSSSNIVKNYARLKSGVLEIASPFNNDYFLVLTFKESGPSLTWQISDAYLLERGTTFSFNNNRISYFTVNSDFVGPYYNLRAVENADGDDLTGTRFTGGYHGSNGDATGGATSTKVSIAISADNLPMAEGVVYACDKVTLNTVNHVHGSNTSKADGTGRGILSENQIYTISKNKISVENIITPLEKITLDRYMFIQALLKDFKTKFLAIDDNVKKGYFTIDLWGDYTKDVASGVPSESQSNEIRAFKSNGDYMKVMLDKSTGIGDFAYNPDTRSRWLVSSGANKFYFYPVATKLEIDSSTTLYGKGSYEFISGNL